MRRIVAKYTKRYMDSRKYRKQLVAEEAVRRIKRAPKGQTRARFLRRLGRENCWEEVDDRIACDKVSHALRCFVRKLEEGNGELVSDADEESSVGDEEEDEMSDTEEVPSSVSQESKDAFSSTIISSKTLQKSASGVDALKRLSPIHTHPLGLLVDPLLASHAPMAAGMFPASAGSLKLSGLLPGLVAPPLAAGIRGSGLTPITAAEAELDYRMSLQRLSTRGLMDLVAAERAHLTDPLASSLTSNALATARMEHQLLQQRILNRARMQELLSIEQQMALGLEVPKEIS